jgi:predicted ATP-grasp superfamily ATP-dependent carboligase
MTVPRRDFPVLVPEAQSLGALAVIRSLGRAGYPVHALAASPDAVGQASRYAAARAVHPSYGSADFLPWMRDYIGRSGACAVVPSEGFLMAVRPAIREYVRLMPVPRDPEVLYAGMAKYDFFASGARDTALRHTTPPTLLVTDDEPDITVEALTTLGRPLFVKTDTLYARPAGGATGGVRRCEAPDTAATEVRRARGGFTRVVVQGYVPGSGVGAFLVRWNGRVLARFMHERVHEVPHTGGASSFRRSFWHDGIMTDAERRLAHMEWEGPAMVEYRLDRATGRYAVMELNGRFWGSLHLALFAGVDFPTILLDAFRGELPGPVPVPRRVSARHTFPGEVQHVASVLRTRAWACGARRARWLRSPG